MRGERTLVSDPRETCTRGQLLMLRMRVGEPESKIKANESKKFLIFNLEIHDI